MRELLRKALKVAVKLTYPVAIYYWVIWSRIYRTFNSYDPIILKTGLTPAKAQDFMSNLPWSPDTWKELWDVCGSPQRFQRDLNVRLRTGMINTGPRDCDDFACWAANVIDAKYSPRMLLVCYLDRQSILPKGHVVCYVEMDEYGFHVGNWGLKGPFSASYLDVATAVASQKGAELLAFATLTKDLGIETIKRV